GHLNRVAFLITSEHYGKVAMSEKCEVLVGQLEVLIGISFGEDVVILVGYSAVDELCVTSNLERTDGKISQIVAIGIRQNGSRPVGGASGMRIKLRGFV